MAEKLGAIGDYVQETMASWQVPGVALAVIQGDEVVHMAGYGVRNVETGQPVTPNTRFPIASMTKAFTAMGVALLVDEGKVTWDKPVREYFPSFKLKDDYASEHISLRDMLCHRSGLPRHDLAWYGTPYSREELIHNVRYHRPNKTYRESWEYQNLMYVTAGYVTGLMTDMTWEEFIQHRIFDPLDMTSSGLYIADMLKGDDYAMPYRIRREKDQPDRRELMPFYDNPVMGPAGNIYSSLSDLVSWLKVHLNEGRHGDQQFVSAGNLSQMHQPQMIRPVDGTMEKLLGTTLSAYGMGWFIEPYRGYTLLHHGGNIDGFSLIAGFIPQAEAGVIVLTNLDGRPLRDVLLFEVCDRMLGLSDHQWNVKYHANWAEMFKAQDQERETTDDERVPDTHPSHPLADYAGEYAAEGYADMKVKVDGDQLYGWLAGDWWKLTHYHYDIFELHLDRFELHTKVIFQTDTRGRIGSVSVPVESTVENVIFTRKPEKAEAAALAELAGEYAMPLEGVMLTIRHKPDGRLFAQMTGQPELELIPYQISADNLEFTVKDVPNVALSFVREEGSRAALLKQFGAVFRAPRTTG